MPLAESARALIGPVAERVLLDLVDETGETANLAGDQVIIGGNAAVTAFGAAPKAGYVLAVESLDITGNAVNIGGDATSRATANNANLGKSASASANLFVTVTHAGSLGTFLHGNDRLVKFALLCGRKWKF